MKHSEIIKGSLENLLSVTEELDGVRVVTHCMYPSNGFVQVVVRGGTDTFFVSDEGGAFREIEAAGVDVEKPDKVIRHLVVPQGLSLVNGMIRSPQVSADSLAISISLVANASKEAADWLFAHSRIKRHRNFKEVVGEFLKERFSKSVRSDIIIGASNKPHKFDNLISLGGGRRLLVDPVIHDSASINARLVANFDVRSAHYKDLEQRIVYDDEEEWRPEELNLLQVGATVVPFSRAPDVFARLAAHG